MHTRIFNHLRSLESTVIQRLTSTCGGYWVGNWVSTGEKLAGMAGMAD